MLSRVVAVLIIMAVPAASPVASAPADDSTTVTVDVDSTAGPAVPALAGVGWNTGDLRHISPLKPALVRIDARPDEISPGEGVLAMDPLFEKVDTILATGSRPLILLNRMPPWLARPVPLGCRQERRDLAPCPPTAMGPKDLEVWEQLIEDIVRRLAERFPRDLAFELWNEPNNLKRWADSDQVFVDTTMAMHRAIARVEGETGLDFSVGGVAVGHVDPELTREQVSRGNELLRRYREAAVEQGTPPDFISWHDYTRDPLDYGRDVGEVRNLIADPSTPLIITEWNHYGLKNDARNTAIGAAFNLAALTEMENAGVSQANFFRSVSFGPKPSDPGLVTGSGTPRPSWWTLQLWNSLRGGRLNVSGHDPEAGMWARATRAGDKVDVILTSYAEKDAVTHDISLALRGTCDASKAVVRWIDGESPSFRSSQTVNFKSATISLASPAVAWISVDCSGSDKATEIDPHPQSSPVGQQADSAPTDATKGNVRIIDPEAEAAARLRARLIWTSIGVAALLAVLVVARTRRRRRKRGSRKASS